MITDNAKSLALQAILYFKMQHMAGKTRSEAVQAFVDGNICRAFGDQLTVANVYGLAAAGGYDVPRCPKCGYSAEDQATHGDHHLCDGVIPDSV